MSGYYRLEVKMINRSTKNIVASASYRADEKLYSERTNEYIEFAKHKQVPDSFIITPSHAPDWAKGREKLWNEVDKKEKSVQNNSQLAREVLLSLPNDNEHEINKEMVKNFVNDEFVSKGMVADVSIHTDDKNNPHAHVLLTVRPFEKNGDWGVKRRDEYVYDEEGNHVLTKSGNRKRTAVHSFEFDKKYIKEIRNKYEKILNEYADRYNKEERYSSKSYEDQGRKEIPLKRLTREEYYIEQKEKERCEKENKEYIPVTYYGKINKEIEDYNKGLIENIEEDLNDKVIHINDIIRNHKSNIELDKDSFNIVMKRNKGYVNYESARSIQKGLDSETSKYGRMINHEKHQLQFKKEYYKNLYEVYNADKNKVKDYGYNPKTFSEDIDKDIHKLTEDVKKFSEKESKYNELYNAVNTVVNYFEDSNEELYRKVFEKENTEFYNHSNEEIYKYIEETKAGNFIDITEIKNLSVEDIPAITNFDHYSALNKEVHFAKRDIAKLSFDLSDTTNPDDMKDKMFNLHFRSDELQKKEIALNEYEETINDDFIQNFKFKEFSYEELDDIDTYNKVRMIEQVNKSDNNFTEENIFDYYSDKEYEEDKFIEQYNFNQVSFDNFSRMSDDLFSSYNEVLHDIDRKAKYKDLYMKGKKEHTYNQQFR